jgi:acyl-CoA reductase-like NAD-dependent aldehyde dehydrogenase
VKAIKQGDPRDINTMVGAQASQEQQDKIMSYLMIGREEGAEVLDGRRRAVRTFIQQCADWSKPSAQ